MLKILSLEIILFLLILFVTLTSGNWKIFSCVLIGLLLDSFVDPSEFTGGKAVIYPVKAYATLFGLLLIPTAASFVISLFLPETKGHYVREDYSKQVGRS